MGPGCCVDVFDTRFLVVKVNCDVTMFVYTSFLLLTLSAPMLPSTYLLTQPPAPYCAWHCSLQGKCKNPFFSPLFLEPWPRVGRCGSRVRTSDRIGNFDTWWLILYSLCNVMIQYDIDDLIIILIRPRFDPHPHPSSPPAWLLIDHHVMPLVIYSVIYPHTWIVTIYHQYLFQSNR